jgi:toxin YoeB
MPALEQLAWTAAAWNDYLHWHRQDRRQLRRINQLIQACLRDPCDGIGKPEPLRESLAGCWSRRIDAAHRLVYGLNGDLLVILACRYHYRWCQELAPASQKPHCQPYGSPYDRQIGN